MYSPIVTEFPGFIRCTIAGPSSTAASLRGRVGGPGGASASKSGSMSALVPWNICPLRDSDGGLRPGMGRLHVKCNRLRLRALQGFTIAITITITAILYVIDYDCDYIGM